MRLVCRVVVLAQVLLLGVGTGYNEGLTGRHAGLRVGGRVGQVGLTLCTLLQLVKTSWSRDHRSLLCSVVQVTFVQRVHFSLLLCCLLMLKFVIIHNCPEQFLALCQFPSYSRQNRLRLCDNLCFMYVQKLVTFLQT